MAVVIRLQGLRVTAGTEDIRKFFSGLKIPDGGVHIIGGEREEAFIIFASDEDARRAMARSGHCLKDAPVALLLSSKAEMQCMLERSTKMAEMEQRRRFEDNARPARLLVPEMGRRPGSRSSHSPPIHQRAPINDDDSCVFLRGLPYSVTENEIQDFFSGLIVDDIALLKKKDGSNNGAGFVKFATIDDAREGLNRDKKYIGNRYIEVSPTTVQNWFRTIGRPPMTVNSVNSERDRSPVRIQRNPQNYGRSQSPPNHMPIAPDNEYCVLLDNLSLTVEKQDIKKLFQHAMLEDDQILHLKDSEGRRTRSTFVLFKNQRDYCEALSQEKRMFFNRWVNTRPISRENMIALLESHSMDAFPRDNSEQFQERPPSFPDDGYDSEKLCVFVRNMPLDVRKVEIIDFFFEFDITENKVFLLYDYGGAGVGKALVLFQSQAEAMRAMSLNGQRFLGSEVTLKCISRSQMRQLGVDPPMESEPPLQQGRFSGRNSEASYRSVDDEYLNVRTSRDRNMQFNNVQAHRGNDCEPCVRGPRAQNHQGNGSHGNFGPSMQLEGGPTCVQLLNLPFQIRTEEIYDFCYGYRVIPGSVSLQFDQGGKPTGSATVVFESRPEASIAVEELSGRPIGPRKIKLLFV